MAAHDTDISSPSNDVYSTVVRAWHAGLCPLPTATDGSKRPGLTTWKQYQASRPTLDQLDTWFSRGHPGWGTLCGTVAGNLEMLELEGRAYAEGMWDEFCHRCDAAGMGDVLNRVINGYAEHTPSNGVHLVYNVEGIVYGNTKLARRPDGDQIQVLFETRGEGGFTILAPSHGPTHPSGRSWDLAAGSVETIATITAAERDGLFHVARTFDEMPEPSTVVTMPANIVLRPHRPDAESWMQALVDDLARTPWGDVLARYGIRHHHDAGTITYWTRPGKDTKDGYSATTNAKGTDRLIVFSTSMPLEAWTGAGPAPSYDRLDVIAAYEHGGDRTAAARALTGRTAPVDRVAVARTEPDPPQTFDDAFWASRPTLEHIRTAARSRMVAPAAVLGCVLARVAAFTPPSTCLPPIIGTTAPLSTYIALRGHSGGGKSSAIGCAEDLLPHVPPGCVGPLPLGSGEGLIDAYFELVEDDNGAGKKTKVKRQTRHGAQFVLDEGQALAEMGNRKGSTILPILRSAWSGADAGQANASIETRRTLPKGSYSIGLVSLWQDHAAARLLDDAAGGTPQRFVFIETTDPTVSVDNPPWPGELAWTPPPVIAAGGRMQRHPMTVDAGIIAEVKNTHAAVQRGEITLAPLDAHRRLVKLKLAGTLAVLDGRHDVTLDDWALAERIMGHSDGVRAWIAQEAHRRATEVEEASARRSARREAIIEESAVSRAMTVATKAIYRAAAKHPEGILTRRMAHAAVAHRYRVLVSTDEAIAEAERLRWLVQQDDETWKVGDARPT